MMYASPLTSPNTSPVKPNSKPTSADRSVQTHHQPADKSEIAEWMAYNSKHEFTLGQALFSFLRTLILGLAIVVVCILITERYRERARIVPHKESHFHDGQLAVTVVQQGRVFTSYGSPNFVAVSSPLTSSMIYSFSPEVEESFHEATYDPFNETSCLALGPAILPLSDGSFLTVQRISMVKNNSLFYSSSIDIPRQLGYAFARRFDANWSPIGQGQILGVPAAGDPSDMRLFSLNGSANLLLHFASSLARPSRTFVWNLEKNRLNKIRIPSEINDFHPNSQDFVPLVVDNNLFLINSFDPLRILSCAQNGKCAPIDDSSENFQLPPFEPYQEVLRGGTPFILYEWPYYIGIAHSQTFTVDFKILRAAHLVVIDAISAVRFRVAYVSSPLHLDDHFFSEEPKNREMARPFMVPTGIALRSPDVIDFGAQINDKHGFIFRLKGVKNLIEKVLHAEQEVKPEGDISYATRFRQIQQLTAIDSAAYFGFQKVRYPEILEIQLPQ